MQWLAQLHTCTHRRSATAMLATAAKKGRHEQGSAVQARIDMHCILCETALPYTSSEALAEGIYQKHTSRYLRRAVVPSTRRNTAVSGH